MDKLEKLKILTDAAKYDVACTSSGSDRSGKLGSLGNSVAAGICHSFSSDGRCISLLKILLTNYCIFDCKYCVNRKSNDTPRAVFTPIEISDIMMNFYRRNYVEGLFLSSGIIKSPNYTMELMHQTLHLIRNEHKFNGYIHVKAIPGADQELIYRTGLLADRMSINIELPSNESLKLLAPDKTKESIIKPMTLIQNNIVQNKNELVLFKNAPKFVPAGQSTQLIVGATPESDNTIITLSENLYKKFGLKRVFYSAFLPVNKSLPKNNPPLLREHRLYQADWLLRYYGFEAKEIFDEKNPNLSLNMDPKCQWAIRNLHLFPTEINTADYYTLLRIPGIAHISATKILKTRKVCKLNFEVLKKLGIVLKRAKYFITCDGQMYEKNALDYDVLNFKLSENKIGEQYKQLNLFEKGEEICLIK